MMSQITNPENRTTGWLLAYLQIRPPCHINWVKTYRQWVHPYYRLVPQKVIQCAEVELKLCRRSISSHGYQGSDSSATFFVYVRAASIRFLEQLEARHVGHLDSHLNKRSYIANDGPCRAFKVAK